MPSSGDRLLATEVAHDFLKRVADLARGKGLMSPDHFSVDGTLTEAWASQKSFRPKGEDPDDKDDGNGWSNFKGQKRPNGTHKSKTDPDARLARKGNGQPARLAYTAHALMENRNGLIVDFEMGTACGTAERDPVSWGRESRVGLARSMGHYCGSDAVGEPNMVLCKKVSSVSRPYDIPMAKLRSGSSSRNENDALPPNDRPHPSAHSTAHKYPHEGVSSAETPVLSRNVSTNGIETVTWASPADSMKVPKSPNEAVALSPFSRPVLNRKEGSAPVK